MWRDVELGGSSQRISESPGRRLGGELDHALHSLSRQRASSVFRLSLRPSPPQDRPPKITLVSFSPVFGFWTTGTFMADLEALCQVPDSAEAAQKPQSSAFLVTNCLHLIGIGYSTSSYGCKLRSNSNGGASLDTGRSVNLARDCLIAGGRQGESGPKRVRAGISLSKVIVGGEKRGWIRACEMHRTVDDCIGLAVDGCDDRHREGGTGRCARRSRKLQNCVRVSATT